MARACLCVSARALLLALPFLEKEAVSSAPQVFVAPFEDRGGSESGFKRELRDLVSFNSTTKRLAAVFRGDNHATRSFSFRLWDLKDEQDASKGEVVRVKLPFSNS